ncbi:MAG TPA: hypothetical protein VG347_10710 [Verrucomicrobiae bacterium]|nr:hypothetical protein [Verrucomicrobiae bacterium]
MNFIHAYETRGERWAARIRGFVRWFYHRKDWHIPISFLLFLVAFIEPWHQMARLLEGVVWAFLGLYAACWVTLLMARSFLRPYPYPPKIDSDRHVLDGFCILPMAFQVPRFSPYKLRLLGSEKTSAGWMVPNEFEMEAFVDFGHRALEEAHPTLSRDERRKTYQRWWECQSNSFLLLEKLESDGKRRVIAVSIILPLTELGHKLLRDGERRVLDLGSAEIDCTTRGSKHLLIDTWILRPAYRRRYTGFEYALILKHLSIFWDPSQQNEVTVLVEPDASSIRTLARLSNFHGPSRTKDGGQLYAYHFPHDYADARLERRFEAIKNNMVKCQSLPL